MDAEHALIAQRLDGFQFGADPGVAGFAERLARENAWPREHAARVIREYKRFVCLAVTASQPVAPSDCVDQAWHLHLTYSSQYWDHFCPSVLGRPLHHHPSVGGAVARRRCVADYERTLALYREVFGEPAPAEIWPTPAQRFGRDGCWARIDTAESLILPRRGAVIAAWGMALVLVALALHGLWSGAIGAFLLAALALTLGGAWLAQTAQCGAEPRGPLEPERRTDTSSDALTPDLGVLLTLSAGTASLSSTAHDGHTGADAAASEGGADHAGEGADAGDADGGADGCSADAGGGCSGGGCGGCGGGCSGGD